MQGLRRRRSWRRALKRGRRSSSRLPPSRSTGPRSTASPFGGNKVSLGDDLT